jgi:TonB family protein
MPARPPRSIIFSRSSEQESWIARVSENLHQLLMPMKFSSPSPNGAPLHLIDLARGHRADRAQICSLLTHVMAVALLLYLAARITDGTMRRPPIAVQGGTILGYVPPRMAHLLGVPSLGRNGGSGDENPIPATRGNLAPRSSMPLLAPHLPQNEKPELPVPVAIFDAEAPPFTNPITHLGLPWMPSDTNSGGPGKNHGIGEGPGHGMGDEGMNGEGFGTDGRTYTNVVSWPVCTYCPDPSYTEEARKGKFQGTITLRILVTADGRAAQVHVVKGLSGDLDERAAQTVKGWRFVTAKDAARRSVAVWMTVEVVYRLF